VLGLANSEEIAEVESLRLQYPEVEDAIMEFSVLIEEQAFENAVAPPPFVKSKIMAAIHEEDRHTISPVFSLSPNEEGNSVVHITFFRKWRILAAASTILAISSTALNFYLYNKYSRKNSAYQSLLTERNTLASSNQVYQTHLREWEVASRMMADTEMAMIKMPGVPGKPQHLATVFWHSQSKDVYIMPNKLPLPAAGKQYQLWALVNGKPVDAGMLDPSCNSICKMKNVPYAQAFAITLENAGGSATPTMTQLFVMGKV
jgi:anti-sigma-K factor RskA